MRGAHVSYFLDNLLHKLQDSLSVLSPELIPIHERLVNIRRQLVALAAKETAREVDAADAHAEKLEDLKGNSSASSQDSESSEAESKTPTRESTPKPDGHREKEGKDGKEGLRVKAELKPIQEELRRIDS